MEMEKSSIDGGLEPANSESKIPYILAIAALAVAILSFAFAWATKSNLNRHKDTIIKEVNEAVDVAKQAAADARNAGNGSENTEQLKADFEQLKIQIAAKYDEIARSQTLVIQNQQKANDRLSRLENRSGSTTSSASSNRAPAQATASNSSNNRNSVASSANGKYKVEKGDYPAKIAKKLGVSLNDLMSANPGLDPKRLQIGQELNVPEKK